MLARLGLIRFEGPEKTRICGDFPECLLSPGSPVVFEAYPPDEVEGESSQRRLDFGSQDSGYGFVRGQDGDPSSPVYDSELNHDDAPPFYDIYPAFE
ncbi:hypothetical protein SK128_012214 [Halocaridina rubra]|uniref:Uncharacterized protein n=1 Tax=Halocaridina rubra TaxID=373956 RepID=A0AAN9A6C7_HALRR